MADDKQDKKNERQKTDDGTLVVETVGRDFRVEGNDVSGYIGVDPEYRTYAGVDKKPFITDEDVTILEASGQPTDVELLTLQYGTPPKTEDVDKEESEEVDCKSGSAADAKPTATKAAADAKGNESKQTAASPAKPTEAKASGSTNK